MDPLLPSTAFSPLSTGRKRKQAEHTAKLPLVDNPDADYSPEYPTKRPRTQREPSPTASSPGSSSSSSHYPSKSRKHRSKYVSGHNGIILPSERPLITRETLKELDLDQILRNPQLRHDLLFDPSLQFRPTSGRRKRDATSKYWLAVQRELETGCTCTSWDASGRPLPCVCLDPPPQTTRVGRSRIFTLVSELFEVIVSVIKPPTNGSSSATSNTQQQPSLPILAQIESLRAALDPVLIVQELRHNVFDPKGLFLLLGDILKTHCAPMRDRAVETMVSLGTDSEGKHVKALKMCFEILELMKLDIANHHLQSLRPYLVQTAPAFELSTFRNRDTPVTLTQKWFRTAHLAQLPDGLPRTLPISVAKGMTDLVFHPPTASFERGQGWPETLYLDLTRMSVLVADAHDLVAAYMLLMLFRQLHRGVVSTSDLERVKKELWEVGPCRLGYGIRVGIPSAADDEKEYGNWRTGLENVLLHLASLSLSLSTPPPPPPSDDMPDVKHPRLPAPSQETLAFLEGWAATNMRRDSKLTGLLRSRVQAAVEAIVFAKMTNPTPSSPSDARLIPGGNGLEPLAHEIQHLAEQIAKLASFHVEVYSPIYQSQGFLEL